MVGSDERRRFLADVIKGLGSSPKTIPCKYLYDARGSKLFDAICKTREYYVTRADLALHEQHLPEISKMIGAHAHVIEFGAGSGLKTRKLLASLEAPRAYTPIEISVEALTVAARELMDAFPEIDIRPVQADYSRPIAEAHLRLEPPPRRRIVYFPGSTISNFDHDDAVHFLERMWRVAGVGGAILIGVDLLKPTDQLLAAYDDSDGVTADFNINLLNRLRNELNANVEIEAFAHEARFDLNHKRIEMHLVAERETRIRIGNDSFEFKPGESIHTENSYKYSVEDFRALAGRAGLESIRCWKDPEGLFSMHWLEGW